MNHEFEPVACRSIVIFPFEDVSGLAVECLADGVQRGEADGFGTSVLQNGHVGGSDANLFGELAEQIGITPANVSILKNGRAKAVRFTTLDAICKALDCQPGDILEWEDDD